MNLHGHEHLGSIFLPGGTYAMDGTDFRSIVTIITICIVHILIVIGKGTMP